MKKVWLFLLLASIICCVACNSTDEKIETEVETDYAEGAPSTESINLQGTMEYAVGDTIVFESDELSYELTIDKVSYVEAQNEHAETPEHVVLVDYTYKNTGDGFLLIDDMRFQLITDDNNHVYEPYYYEGLVSADLAENGKSISAQIAFAQDDDKDIALIYRDTSDENVKPVCIRIDEVNESN